MDGVSSNYSSAKTFAAIITSILNNMNFAAFMIYVFHDGVVIIA